MEITFGMGAFSKAATPELINGKKCSLDVDGAVHYKFKASLINPKYIVPVEISYTDQEGKNKPLQKILNIQLLMKANNK